MSPAWNTALQKRRLKWCINKLHHIWASAIRSTQCPLMSTTSISLNRYAGIIMSFISQDKTGRYTDIKRSSRLQHALLRHESNTTLSLSTLLIDTHNHESYKVHEAWTYLYDVQASRQHAFECFGALRACKRHNDGFTDSGQVYCGCRQWCNNILNTDRLVGAGICDDCSGGGCWGCGGGCDGTQQCGLDIPTANTRIKTAIYHSLTTSWRKNCNPVSYTHLTLPTNRCV